jgi:hypothetical protein
MRLIRSGAVFAGLLLGAAIFSLAGTAAVAAPLANDTGAVIGTFYPDSGCTGVPDGAFTDVFVNALPGTTQESPVPSGAGCVDVTNLSNDPVGVSSSSGGPQTVIAPRRSAGVKVNFWQGISVTDESGSVY